MAAVVLMTDTTRPDLGAGATALVPMKAVSVRVPCKNTRLLCGVPLYYHVLRALGASTTVGAIAVDTDSDEIKAALRSDFPDVLVIDRPSALAGPEVPMNAVIAHDLSILPGEVFAQTHSTNPLLTSATIDSAVRAFMEDDGHDALFTVTPLHKRFYRAGGEPVNHDPAVLVNTQDLEPLYEENSCLYVFTRSGFEATGNRLCTSPRMFPIPAAEAYDIDEESDMLVAEAALRRRETPGEG